MAMHRSSRTRRDGTSSNQLRRYTLVHIANTLSRVFAGRTLESAFTHLPRDANRPLVFEICYGTVRHYFSLKERLTPFIDKPIDTLDTKVWVLLLAGAYQLQYTQVKPHVLVSEAVHAVRLLGYSSASGFVNAVLRKYDPTTRIDSLQSIYEQPSWFIESLKSDHPDYWKFVLKTSLTRAPLTLRVNRSIISPPAYRNRLQESKVEFSSGPYRETISLKKPMPQTKIPGIDRGEVSIQDSHSQIAVNLLNLQEGIRVLDACAAPGVKTLQILDTQPKVELFSIDHDSRRSQWFDTQPSRLRQQHRIQICDALALDWWDGLAFDRIILDAPCTGTGTLRRHPDIKLHRTPEDVVQAQVKQLALLKNLWDMLAIEGILLYCTCSVLATENHDVIRAFCSDRSDVRILPVDILDGIPSAWGRQLLPTKNGGDGFFFSLLQRISPT